MDFNTTAIKTICLIVIGGSIAKVCYSFTNFLTTGSIPSHGKLFIDLASLVVTSQFT